MDSSWRETVRLLTTAQWCQENGCFSRSMQNCLLSFYFFFCTSLSNLLPSASSLKFSLTYCKLKSQARDGQLLRSVGERDGAGSIANNADLQPQWCSHTMHKLLHLSMSSLRSLTVIVHLTLVTVPRFVWFQSSIICMQCIKGVFLFFIFIHVPSANLEVGFMIYTATNHHGAVEMICLPFRELSCRPSLYTIFVFAKILTVLYFQGVQKNTAFSVIWTALI